MFLLWNNHGHSKHHRSSDQGHPTALGSAALPALLEVSTRAEGTQLLQALAKQEAQADVGSRWSRGCVVWVVIDFLGGGGRVVDQYVYGSWVTKKLGTTAFESSFCEVANLQRGPLTMPRAILTASLCRVAVATPAGEGWSERRAKVYFKWSCSSLRFLNC